MTGKSKEEIAFELVSKLKGVGVWGENNMTAILDMYAQCLEATSGLRSVDGKPTAAQLLANQSAPVKAAAAKAPAAPAARQTAAAQPAAQQAAVQQPAAPQPPVAQQPQVRQQQQMLQQAYQQQQAPTAR